MKELPKVYDPSTSEQDIYEFWKKGGFFHADEKSGKKPFTIMMPPPNVTGILHIGHAFNMTVQDVLTRFKRMQGYAALWMPGTDHAGLATQIKVEAHLRETEKITRYDLGREKFIDRCWDWKEKNGNIILNQIGKLGASCDWDRLRFTFDEGCCEAVNKVFVELYNNGLIYKGRRIISWCPKCKTALSDTEVEYEDQAGHLWYIKYPIEGTDEYLVVATTRPETMMGDSGVAVHPDDERYKKYIGKNVILPLMNRPIPIFADEYVETEFGTGCVKVTPCHDPNDFEMGQRHNLDFILIMDEDAKINENGGKYQGLTRDEARKAVIEDLDALGLLIKTEDYRHNVGTCYRCGTTVEPMSSSQWFVKMKPLAEEAIRVVKDGEVRFVPDRFSKIYLNWMENVHDWCISRQIWWGHRIPAYYCQDCGEMTVSETPTTVCPKCGGTHIVQDEDVLDTWFSSALWPFSTLGWPEKTPALDYFYPTDVLVTGYDIIFFWVARMIFSGNQFMKKPPFHTVLITGLIRDSQGRKMSKSLGNGVDPLQVIEQYGADALRFTLCTGIGPGNDARYYDERVQASRNFANKIWNASRFVMMNLTVDSFTLPEKLEMEDRWILSTFNTLVKEVTENLNKYEIGVAADKVSSFIWDSYCDWFIELCKPRLAAKNEDCQRVLGYVLTGALKLLHPFMPFLTETIWQALPHDGPALMVADWPEYDEKMSFKDDERDFQRVIGVVRAIRNRRSEMNVPPSKKASLMIFSDDPAPFKKASSYFEKLAYVSSIEYLDKAPADVSKLVSMVAGGAQLYMPMSDLVDKEKELARINAEIEKAQANVERLRGKLSNESFVSKAPEAVVNAERARLADAETHLAGLKNSLKALQD